jgi:hypothetical protein
VSLLSELIAQLNALIEQHRRTASDMQGARETVEGAAALVQAATVDSRNPLVERGIGQWLAAMEKLGEARVLLTAGDRSMSDYLHGPLLGGSKGASGGSDSSSGSVAPTSRPRLTSGVGDADRTAQVTWPRFEPDPDRRPSGPPTPLEGTTGQQNDLDQENEAAKILAQAGYDIEQNPPPRPNGRNPDYRIQGEYFDCYTPGEGSVRTIETALRKKVGKTEAKIQADRIILNLDGAGASAAEIRAHLERFPIRRLKEIKIIEGGRLTQFYPWDAEGDDSGD